jgi:hypothetical protein
MSLRLQLIDVSCGSAALSQLPLFCCPRPSLLQGASLSRQARPYVVPQSGPFPAGATCCSSSSFGSITTVLIFQPPVMPPSIRVNWRSFAVACRCLFAGPHWRRFIRQPSIPRPHSALRTRTIRHRIADLTGLLDSSKSHGRSFVAGT